MKKCILVNIHDTIADVYSAPMLFENEDCARRYFSTLLVNNPNKDDYKLCKICYYIPQEGCLSLNSCDDEVQNYIHSDVIMKGSEING